MAFLSKLSIILSEPESRFHSALLLELKFAWLAFAAAVC